MGTLLWSEDGVVAFLALSVISIPIYHFHWTPIAIGGRWAFDILRSTLGVERWALTQSSVEFIWIQCPDPTPNAECPNPISNVE